MEIKAYLERIGCTGELGLTLESLAVLQKAHLLAVPFENLDIHNGTVIKLELPRLYDKVVRRRRGGFCYELNGLFGALLQDLGHEVRRVSGSVFTAEKGYGPPFDHMALVVSIDGAEYLSDVGFGEFAFGPLKLGEGAVTEDERGRFRMNRLPEGDWLVSKWDGEKWVPQYRFWPHGRELLAFDGMCAFHQWSPASHFSKKRFISLPVAGGRVSLGGLVLKETFGERVEERELKGEAEFEVVLREVFGVVLVRQA